MSTAERECDLVLDSSASPLVLVSTRLAAAHSGTPQAFGRELREKHVALLESVPPEVFERHSHVVPFTSSGVEWVFAVVRLHAHGVQGVMLVAVLRDEVSNIGPAVNRVRADLARRTGRFLQ